MFNCTCRHSQLRYYIGILSLFLLTTTNLLHGQGSDTAAKRIVDGLSFASFKQDIQTLARFGDRRQGSESFDKAAKWIGEKLTQAGYTVEHHDYKFLFFRSRHNIYVTKVGTTSPDSMYIVSAHLDGRGGGGAADDDGSGSALVLEAALALAPSNIRTEKSIRFILWNNEETGLNGSAAYVDDRAELQGREEPPGSGRYPEPHWLGVVQHDMILFDHGLPVQGVQILDADIDIEYQASSDFANLSRALATTFRDGNQAFSSDYPAEIGSNMRNTDSWSFRNLTAAISVRENQRIAEIGKGSNPHWHQTSDVPGTYSDADFKLGFNALQMTLGTVAKLAGVSFSSKK